MPVTRQWALEHNCKIYTGKLCSKCGCCSRYIRSGNCIHCRGKIKENSESENPRMLLTWNNEILANVMSDLLDVDALALQCEQKILNGALWRNNIRKPFTTKSRHSIIRSFGFKSDFQYNTCLQRAKYKVKHFLVTHYGVTNLDDLGFDRNVDIEIKYPDKPKPVPPPHKKHRGPYKCVNREYLIQGPDKKTVVVHSLAEFCRAKNIKSYPLMRNFRGQLMPGDWQILQMSYNGTITKAVPYKPTFVYKITGPKGKITVYDLKTFCKLHNVNYAQLYTSFKLGNRKVIDGFKIEPRERTK